MGIELARGAVVGRYRLLRPLGEGGMGCVWAASDPETGEHVALKFLKRPSEDTAPRRRFLREARAASLVRHPHVRRIYEMFEIEGGQPVMVMEFLVGESLKQRLARDRKIPLPELARLMLPVVSAVGKAHEMGIIHRDLTPANIFLPTEAGGAVKVLDFGIAKRAVTRAGDSGESSVITGSDALLGTPCYMSPEQVFCSTDLDHRTDIWSLGIILYEALSGVLPTQGGNVGQTLKRVVHPITPLRDIAPDLPNEVTELVAAMLSPRVENRTGDLRAVEAVLVRYALPSFGPPASAHDLAEGAASAPKPRAPACSEEAPTLDPTTGPDLRPAPKSDRVGRAPGGRNKAAVAAGLSVAMAVAGAWWWARTRPPTAAAARLADAAASFAGSAAPQAAISAATRGTDSAPVLLHVGESIPEAVVSAPSRPTARLAPSSQLANGRKPATARSTSGAAASAQRVERGPNPLESPESHIDRTYPSDGAQ